MQAWYHCENTYPFVPQEVLDRADSVRGSLPNKYCDPKIAADLFHECLDEHLLCDDLGVNIVSIEHHAGINSLYGASPLILGIIARQTSKVRILSQGTLVTVRREGTFLWYTASTDALEELLRFLFRSAGQVQAEQMAD